LKTRQAEARRQAIAAQRPERDESGRVMRPLSATSINKTINVLQWVLAIAEERGLIDRNPARGRRRRIPTQPPPPVFLDSATQIEALLNAAAQLDRQSESRTRGRLPLIGTLVFAGLRSGELAALRRRDVDLAAGRILVRRSKTAAGQRGVSVLPILRSLLAPMPDLLSCRRPENFVFATRNGLPRSKDNIRACMLLPVKARADRLLERAGRPPLR
jgi:integrase